ncbi:hypothetical protein PMIN03_000348 [Paraphaeosphaeria minitans]|uniref:Uncharacterized protein n=1 Tax=Paraphaeosphaeria minitans TaxID=565426 RepID=A0A9P6KJB8_9PLEO|nr:hypothetical protein PMIN01_12908 [Paraphaeosphaeria minitans]
MTTVLNMRAFPVASELFSPLTISTRPGALKTSLPLSLPRSTKSCASTALLEMLGIFVCFALGLYIAMQMYAFALGVVDKDLPRAFAVCFCVAYALQLYVGWLEVREEGKWREQERIRNEGSADGR